MVAVSTSLQRSRKTWHTVLSNNRYRDQLKSTVVSPTLCFAYNADACGSKEGARERVCVCMCVYVFVRVFARLHNRS